MSDKLQAMLELERRGKLPPEYAAVLQEARRRKLVPAADTPGAAISPQQASAAPMISRDAAQTAVNRFNDNLWGDDDPNTQNLGEKVGTFLNKAGESMTLGLIGDEASAAVESVLPGVNYADRRDHYRQQEELLEQNSPGAALTADLVGAVAMPVAGAGAVRAGAGLAGAAKRSLASAAATGIGSGVYGAMEGEGGTAARAQDGLNGALLGASIGAAIPVVGNGIQKLADSGAARKAIAKAIEKAPTTDQLRAQGQAAYKAIEDAGVSFRPDAVKGRFDDIVSALQSSGLDDGASALNLTPKAKRMTEVLGETLEGANSVPFRALDQVRRKAGVGAADFNNKTDQRLNTMIIEKLDDLVENVTPDMLDAGDADALPELIEKARQTWARMSKSQMVDDAIEAADGYLSGSGTGLKYQFKRILNNKKLARGFTDAERAVMKRVVDGTISERLLRTAGGGLASIGSLGGLTTGALTGNLGLALAGATATGGNAVARKLSDAAIRKNADIARAIIARGNVVNLPVAKDSSRQIVEQLLRQTAVATPH